MRYKQQQFAWSALCRPWTELVGGSTTLKWEEKQSAKRKCILERWLEHYRLAGVAKSMCALESAWKKKRGKKERCRRDTAVSRRKNRLLKVFQIFKIRRWYKWKASGGARLLSRQCSERETCILASTWMQLWQHQEENLHQTGGHTVISHLCIESTTQQASGLMTHHIWNSGLNNYRISEICFEGTRVSHFHTELLLYETLLCV